MRSSSTRERGRIATSIPLVALNRNLEMALRSPLFAPIENAPWDNSFASEPNVNAVNRIWSARRQLPALPAGNRAP